MDSLTSDLILNEATDFLSKIVKNPRLESEVLLAKTLDKERENLYTNNIPVDEATYQHFKNLLKYRHQGKPIAYIIGTKEFWSLSFKVNENVLIPRPETEQLVESCLSLMKETSSYKLLELGTGSGIISIALAKEHPNLEITAVDISSKALKLANENALSHNISNIVFKQSNWFDNITEQKFDFIISNPPYVDKTQLTKKERANLQYEPEIALFSVDSGKSDLRHIIHESHFFLNHGGTLITEHSFDQKEFCQNQMKEAGFTNIRTLDDLSSHPRVSMGSKL
ncbi:MAG: peptide chain release factor N(5)-glutamine methyltransferase [Gammaproteobacteria bacterium]|nr:peptide chain release factor N(5)-glutamine methyltransferase [Gammaproteobacteria bacterium]